MKEKFLFVGIIALAVVALDHYTKWLIVENLAYDSSVSIFDGIFEIVHTRNLGAAFGMLSAWDSPYRNLFFYTIGGFAFWFLSTYIQSTETNDKMTLTALAFIAGGAAGNLTDRFFRGSVVDFLHLHYYNNVATFDFLDYPLVIPLSWPAFNIADSAISVGVVLLIYRTFFPKKMAR